MKKRPPTAFFLGPRKGDPKQRWPVFGPALDKSGPAQQLAQPVLPCWRAASGESWRSLEKDPRSAPGDRCTGAVWNRPPLRQRQQAAARPLPRVQGPMAMARPASRVNSRPAKTRLAEINGDLLAKWRTRTAPFLATLPFFEVGEHLEACAWVPGRGTTAAEAPQPAAGGEVRPAPQQELARWRSTSVEIAAANKRSGVRSDLLGERERLAGAARWQEGSGLPFVNNWDELAGQWMRTPLTSPLPTPTPTPLQRPTPPQNKKNIQLRIPTQASIRTPETLTCPGWSPNPAIAPDARTQALDASQRQAAFCPRKAERWRPIRF